MARSRPIRRTGGIGVDIGGSHVLVLRTDRAGAVRARAKAPLRRGATIDELLGNLRLLSDRVAPDLPRERSTDEVAGLSFPGTVDPVSGRVVYAPNLPAWFGRPAQALFEEALHRPVHIENDANAAAWAESSERGAPLRELMYVAAGTGIGAGVVVDGRLLRGAWGTAGELGHVGIRGNRRRCGCGNVGCLEALAGGAALGQQAREIARHHPRSMLGRIGTARGIARLEAWDLLTAAERGDRWALEVRNEAGAALGDTLASVVNVLGVSRVVLGGRLVQRAPGFLRALRASWEARLLPPIARKVELHRARDWELRSAVGALRLAELRFGR